MSIQSIPTTYDLFCYFFCRSGRILELSDIHAMIVHKGSPALKPVNTIRAHIQTMSSLPLPIIPGSKFEIYLKGLEVSIIIFLNNNN